MSALTRVLRELVEEGVDVAAATRRWAAERFGDAADTPANAQRVRQAIERAEPSVRRPTANPLTVNVRRRSTTPTSGPLAVANEATQIIRNAADASAARQPRSLAVTPPRREAAPLAVQRAPAAEQPLALPAPAEPMPSFAAKPRGGQWPPAQSGLGMSAFAPETVAEELLPFGWQNSDRAPELRDWWTRALGRYLRNDFGTPEDPLRELASTVGLAETPEAWSDVARNSLRRINTGAITVPNPRIEGAHPLTSTVFAEERAAMPWLQRLPVTEPINMVMAQGMPQGALRGLGYDFEDALRVGQDAGAAADLNIPLDLAVRPESLQRMTFPQAVDRVGRIRQWRTAQQAAQEAERAASAQSNPALRLYRDYAENNPRGLNWVEIAAPEMTDDLLDDFDRQLVSVAEQEGRTIDPAHMDEVRAARARERLQDALSYESDVMGHCVGNPEQPYCGDILAGRTRIFSLRDARGEPHVTVETRPSHRSSAAADHLRQLGVLEEWQDYIRTVPTRGQDTHALSQAWLSERGLPPVDYSASDIIQIKGKGNRAPVDEYLPFVQDFVRQGQWGNIGDLGNTGLVRLPDGRYITTQQAEEGIAAIPETSVPMQFGLDNTAPTMMPRVYDPTALDRLAPEEWEGLSQYFEGYAIGGRVDPDRCFTRHPLSVKR